MVAVEVSEGGVLERGDLLPSSEAGTRDAGGVDGAGVAVIAVEPASVCC